MKKILLVLPSILFFFLTAQAQETENIPQKNIFESLRTKEAGWGSVKIAQDPRLQKLVDKHAFMGSKQKGLQGYRILIFSESGKRARQQANEVIGQFSSMYPGIATYLVFTTPSYKVYAGDFRNKFEAEKIKRQIVSYYPKAFIRNDRINFPKID
jgi:hypothetical protein